MADEQRLRLPSFVDTRALEERLSWAASLKRAFLTMARRRAPIGHRDVDDPFEAVAALLSRPAGGRLTEELVAAADPKRRGLAAALSRVQPSSTGFRPKCGSVAEVRAFVEDKRWRDAAWSAFHQLSMHDPRDGAGDELDELLDICADKPALARLLDPYLADWRASAAGEVALVEETDPAAAWSAEVAALRGLLDGTASFDPDLPERLQAAAESLRALHARALAAAEVGRREAEALAATRGRFEAAMTRLRDDGAVTDLPTVAPAEADAAILAEAADWAEQMLASLAANRDRLTRAEAREAEEDSDEAIEGLAGAKKERRALRTDAAVAGAHWRQRLMIPAAIVTAAPTPAPADAAPPAIPEPAAPTAISEPQTTLPLLDRIDHPPASVVVPTEADEALASMMPEPTTPPSPDPPASPPPSHPDPIMAVAATAQAGELDAFLPAPIATADRPEGQRLAALTRRALRDGRYGFAAHLDRAAQALGVPGIAGSGPVLAALATGAALSPERVGQAATAYASLASRVLTRDEADDLARPVTRLLLLAGALKPAIFFSQTGGAEVFRHAQPGEFGSPLHALCDLLAEMPRRGGHLDFAELAPAVDAQSRRRAADAVRAEILDWVDNAADRRAKFRRADDIVIAVFGAGPVGEAIAAIRRDAAGAADKAVAAAGWLDDDLERRVTALDDEARRPRRGAPMEGQVRHRLATKLGEAATLLRRWATAEKAAQGGPAGHAGELRSQLRTAIAAGADAIEAIEAIDADTALGVAVAVRLFGEVARLLDGVDVGDPRLTLDMVLHDDLLLLNPYPALDEEGDWTEEAATDLDEGADAVLDQPADFDAAFRRLVARGRFAEAAKVIDRIAAAGGERRLLDDQLRELRRQRREDLTREVERLRRQLDDVLGADTSGVVDLSLQLRIDALMRDFAAEASSIDFPDLQAKLRSLQAAVEEHSQLLLAPLRLEIDQLELSSRDRAMLERLADKGDLTTLREQVEAARTGEPLMVPAGLRLKEFAARFLSSAFEKTTPADRNTAALVEAARGRRATAAVDFTHLQEEDVAGATELLAAWRDLKGAKGDATARAINALFSALRFSGVKVTAAPPLGAAKRLMLGCDRIEDRGECPVPAFGSAAKGSYAVLCIETVAVKNGGELFNLVRRQEAPTTRPTFIVIVGGALPATRRREYMVEARKSGALEPTALIDEATILSLASRPGRGLSDLFAITLPTGAVQPYSDANGQTSPEMFFGRRSELHQLWDRNGSCLVYGGRQLGKTALLEQLRLRYHRPPAQVVIGGSIDGVIDLWPRLAAWLKAAGIGIKATHRTAVCQAIRDWLSADGARRLLILADEADIFLEAQMRGDYRDLIQVRDLMQDTERRCKFVFAGLHDVQRLARQPNSPLLHFGTPLRVGPLYGADLGEARAMLEQPMAAAGFTFGADILPGRVLSELGYYPSLLQTFGKTMIDRLNRGAASRMKPADLLPLVIDERDIDEALNDPQFRNKVSGNFEATLSLDERYRLITYAMLVHAMERQGRSPALQDVEVQERALSWWPQGFAQDSTLDAFQGLLKEMVGLGVLIEVDGGYAIRSLRIAAMLGGQQEIERKLFELSEKPGYQKLDTGSLRRLDKDKGLFSPLTARQEGMMLAPTASAVQLVLGSRALGLDDLAGSLEQLADDELTVTQAGFANAQQMLARLDGVPDRRALLVLTGPWPGAEGLASLLRSDTIRGSQRRSRRTLQVVLAPVTVDWAELAALEAAQALSGIDILTLAPLGDTGLRQWLRVNTQAESIDEVAELRALTGGFPLFLRGLTGRTPAELIAHAREGRQRLLNETTTLATLGLADPTLRKAAALTAAFGHGLDTEEYMLDEGIARPRAAAAQLERLGLLEPAARPDEARVMNPFVQSLFAQAA